MEIKKDDCISYETFKNFVERQKDTFEIDVYGVINGIYGVGTEKLYYWTLKAIEEGLVKTVSLTPNPSKWSSHHGNAEFQQCILTIHKSEA